MDYFLSSAPLLLLLLCSPTSPLLPYRLRLLFILRFDAESLLIVAAVMAVDAVDELLQTRVVGVETLDCWQLEVVALPAATDYSHVVVGGDEERRARPQLALKFSEEDAYSRKVEVAEVDVVVGYRREPFDEVVASVLRIARHEEEAPSGV